MPLGARIARNIDVAVLAVALPVWIVAGLPILGWVATTAAWLAARALQAVAERRALAKGSRRAALGARAMSLIGRLYFVSAAVLVAGLIDKDAGVSAGVLAVIVFTVYFVTLLVSNTFGEDAA